MKSMMGSLLLLLGSHVICAADEPHASMLMSYGGDGRSENKVTVLRLLFYSYSTLMDLIQVQNE